MLEQALKKRGRRPTPTSHLKGEWPERLKIARRIAGLSKKVLHERYQLNAHTLASLEIGRSVLSEEWGKRFCLALQNEMVLCSSEWLFSGAGTPPKRLSDAAIAVICERTREEESKVCNDDSAIQDEIETFCKGHPDNVVSIIKDDAMSPFYEFGDYVGARRIPPQAIDQMLGKKCLVEIKSGEYVIRHFTYDEDEEKYLLSALNPNSSCKRPLRFVNEVLNLYQVLWIRRLPKPILED